MDQTRDERVDGPLESWPGYAFTAGGSLVGALIGGAIGFLFTGRLEGDPSAGLANLGLIVAGILMIFLLGLLGSAVGSYLALRLGREPAAGVTAVVMLTTLLPIGWRLRTIEGLGLLALVLVGSLLSRLLAVRASRGKAIERLAVAGVIGLAWLFAYLPSTRSYADVQEARLVATDFQLFEAMKLPSGQELTLVMPMHTDTDHPWIKLEYASSGDTIMLLEYEDFGHYNPPSNCGPEYPSGSPDLVRPCEPVYTTAGGHKVFRSSLSNTAYVRIGSTIITTSWGQEGVEEVLDSLQPVDREKLLEEA